MLIEAARRAAAIVKTWPLWKQNLLTDSMKPTWDTPRYPPALREEVEQQVAETLEISPWIKVLEKLHAGTRSGKVEWKEQEGVFSYTYQNWTLRVDRCGATLNSYFTIPWTRFETRKLFYAAQKQVYQPYLDWLQEYLKDEPTT